MFLPFWSYNSTKWHVSFLSLESFKSYSCLLLISLLQLPPWDFLGMKKGGKGEKNPGDFPLVFLSYSSSCFQKKHLSQNMCSLTTVFTHFQVLLCWVQAREYWRLKKKKVVKSSPVQLYLAFWYSSVIYLLIGTSKSSLIAATLCTNFILHSVDRRLGMFIPSYLKPELLTDIFF